MIKGEHEEQAERLVLDAIGKAAQAEHLIGVVYDLLNAAHIELTQPGENRALADDVLSKRHKAYLVLRDTRALCERLRQRNDSGDAGGV